MRKEEINGLKGLNLNILLLDDDVDMLDSLKKLIERNGYNCFVTSDPKEAMNRVKEENPKIDVFITDYLMIGITGIEVIKEIRKFNKRIYIILLTGFANNMPWDIAMRNFDIDSYSEKDITFKDLLFKIEIARKSLNKYGFKAANDDLKFEERIKRRREELNLTQDMVAEALKISRSTVANYENGLIRPSFEMLLKLAKLYDVSYDFLLG